MVKFEPFIKARYPVLFVVSPEEARIELELMRVLKELKWNLVYWSHTDGFLDNKNNSKDDSPCDDPVEALSRIRKSIKNKGGDFEEHTVFVFRDLHKFFDIPKVQRLIRDISREFKSAEKGAVLVILSPCGSLPIDLQRDVTQLEPPLPNREILTTMCETFISGSDKVKEAIKPPEKFAIIEATLGLTTVEAENALAKGIVEWRSKVAADPNTKVTVSSLVMEEKANAIKKSGVLEWYPADVETKDIGGLANLKKWLEMRKKAFSEEARAFGLPAPRGLMLTGIPGTGKSLAAKACAASFGVPLIRFDVGRVFGSLVGQSEMQMRAAIQTAEAVGRCVLWTDEIEKAFAGLASSGQTDSGVSARVFGAFITWMQEKKAPVFVVATCNNIDSLPPELLRKGRFDEIFYVNVPDPKEREEILKIHITKRGRDPKKFDLKDCVESSDGFSGAELEEAVIAGMYNAFSRGKELNDMFIHHAILTTTPLSKSRASDLAKMKDWALKSAQDASKEKDTGEAKSTRQIED